MPSLKRKSPKQINKIDTKDNLQTQYDKAENRQFSFSVGISPEESQELF